MPQRNGVLTNLCVQNSITSQLPACRWTSSSWWRRRQRRLQQAKQRPRLRLYLPQTMVCRMQDLQSQPTDRAWLPAGGAGTQLRALGTSPKTQNGLDVLLQRLQNARLASMGQGRQEGEEVRVLCLQRERGRAAGRARLAHLTGCGPRALGPHWAGTRRQGQPVGTLCTVTVLSLTAAVVWVRPLSRRQDRQRWGHFSRWEQPAEAMQQQQEGFRSNPCWPVVQTAPWIHLRGRLSTLGPTALLSVPCAPQRPLPPQMVSGTGNGAVLPGCGLQLILAALHTGQRPASSDNVLHFEHQNRVLQT